MKLAVDPRDATVRLTLPVRQPLQRGLAWASEKRDWVEGQLARLPEPQPIMPDMALRVGDDVMTLRWSPEHRRTPERTLHELRIGGPLDSLGTRIIRWLKSEALQTLTEETQALASAHNIVVTHVGIGVPKARWGSCASTGKIRYSWRLILAPEHVRRATVAHEVAHRVYMNHGPAFHALVAELNGGDPAPARRWLRTHGASLYWFGRDG